MQALLAAAPCCVFHMDGGSHALCGEIPVFERFPYVA